MNSDELTAHERRLLHLRKRAAIQGINTPPEILIEIEDIMSRIGEEHSGNSISSNPTSSSPSNTRVTSSLSKHIPHTSIPTNNSIEDLSSSSIVAKEAEPHESPVSRSHRLLSSEYHRRFGVKLLRYLLAVLFITFGIMILVDEILSTRDNMIVGFILGAPILFYGLYNIYHEYARRDYKIIVNPDHIELHQNNKKVTIMWENVEYFQYKTKYKGFLPEHIGYYSIKSSDNSEILLWPSINNLEELAVYIRRQVLRSLLPIAVDLYNSGQPLSFGRFSIDGHGIDMGEEIIYWHDIDYVHLDHVFYVKRKDGEKEEFLGQISEIPNIFLYKRLIYHIIGHSYS